MKRTKRLKATAYHEAGHAIARWQFRFMVYRATIITTGDEAGSVTGENPLRGINLENDGSDRARIRAEKAILISLAGPAAQRRYKPRSWRHHHGRADFECAAEIAIRICGDAETTNAYLKVNLPSSSDASSPHHPPKGTSPMSHRPPVSKLEASPA